MANLFLTPKITIMKLTVTVFLLFALQLTFAQVAINNNGNKPSSSAILDVSSASKGMLMPRMTAAQRKAISNPEVGLLVYDLDKQTLYLFDGAQWRPLTFTTETQLPLIEREPSVQQSDDYVHFGSDVAIDGDYAVVGARAEDVGNIKDQGAAYVYKKENGAWKFQQKLIASNGTNASNFGISVAIHNDVIVVGASNADMPAKANAGAVYIFNRSANTWSEVQILSMFTPEEKSGFGYDVAINNDKIVVSAPYQDINGGEDAGSVFLYQNVSNNWLMIKNLKSQFPFADGHFGLSVDIYNNEVVVGCPSAIFNSIRRGAVYIYSYAAASGNWEEKILHPDYISTDMNFGYSVAIQGDKIIAGAPYWTFSKNGETTELGFVQFFKKTIGVWSNAGSSPGPNSGAKMGYAVDVAGDYQLIGIPEFEIAKGKVWGRTPNGTLTYYDIDNIGVLSFGQKVATSGSSFIIAAPAKNSYKGSVQFGSFE